MRKDLLLGFLGITALALPSYCQAREERTREEHHPAQHPMQHSQQYHHDTNIHRDPRQDYRLNQNRANIRVNPNPVVPVPVPESSEILPVQEEPSIEINQSPNTNNTELADRGSGVFVTPKTSGGVFGSKPDDDTPTFQRDDWDRDRYQGYRNRDYHRGYRDRRPVIIENYYYPDNYPYQYQNYYSPNPYNDTYYDYIPPPSAEYYNNITNPSPSQRRAQEIRFRSNR